MNRELTQLHESPYGRNATVVKFYGRNITVVRKGAAIESPPSRRSLALDEWFKYTCVVRFTLSLTSLMASSYLVVRSGDLAATHGHARYHLTHESQCTRGIRIDDILA